MAVSAAVAVVAITGLSVVLVVLVVVLAVQVQARVRHLLALAAVGVANTTLGRHQVLAGKAQ